MRVDFRYGDQPVEFEVDEDRLVGAWAGPEGRPGAEVAPRVRAALGSPRDFPPLGRAVVPGDRVVIAWDADIPDQADVLGPIVEELLGAGIGAGSIHVLVAGSPRPGWQEALPAGVAGSVHDPDDATAVAYLASTAAGRRVYLNRKLTDADFVLPVGLLGFDPRLGERGPWGVIFPGLSDAATLSAARGGSGASAAALAESLDVSWLLGSQVQVGVVPAVYGVLDVVAGLAAAVQAEGARQLAEAWTFRAAERAGLVVAGVGGPGKPARLDQLADGLATAARLVRRGGKIVVLSGVEGEPGPALQRLMGADDPRAGLAALRGAEGAADYPAARQLAEALAWADVYLLSGLDDDTVEALELIPLARPDEARRLARAADSCLFVAQADRTRADVADEDD